MSLRISNIEDVTPTPNSEEMVQQLTKDDKLLQDFVEEARITVQSYRVIIHGLKTGSLPSRDEALNEDQAVRWIKQRDDVYHQPDGLEVTVAIWRSKPKRPKDCLSHPTATYSIKGEQDQRSEPHNRLIDVDM